MMILVPFETRFCNLKTESYRITKCEMRFPLVENSLHTSPSFVLEDLLCTPSLLERGLTGKNLVLTLDSPGWAELRRGTPRDTASNASRYSRAG